MKFDIKHKTRFDRGRMYYAYGQAIITAFLVSIYSLEISIWFKAVASIGTIFLIYLMGYVDDIFNILKREQDYYSKKNPTLMEMMEEIRQLREELQQRRNENVSDEISPRKMKKV